MMTKLSKKTNMTVPAVYVYKKTSDKGKELRYSLRSLCNISNWNGQVIVVGDCEQWFSDTITVIEAPKFADKYQDTQSKLRAAANNKRVPDDFIYMNDDFFVIRPTTLTPLYDGTLESYTGKNPWQLTKSNTKAYLEAQGITNPKDYDIHVPMVFNKAKLKQALQICQERPGLQIRSLYGNLYQVGGKQYKDPKKPENKLSNGKFASTRMYTPELEALFVNTCEFEK